MEPPGLKVEQQITAHYQTAFKDVCSPLRSPITYNTSIYLYTIQIWGKCVFIFLYVIFTKNTC